ncbi:MAG: thioredoxin family protein [Thermoflexales bacterium]|nr:thioredoxin family protein [Thermoflexales bacterium]
MDGLAQDLEEQARVLRINVLGDVGNQAAHRYGVRGLPTFIVFDGQGQIVHVEAGIPNRARLVEQASRLPNK